MAPPPPPEPHDGPFVQNTKGPGLLRRLLGGGTNDPSSPHSHDADLSTSTMHDSPAMPTRRAATANSTPPPYTAPLPGSSPQRTGSRTPWPFRIIGWMFRTFGIRLVIAAVAGLLVLIGSIGDQRDNLDRISGNLREMNQTIQAQEQARESTAPPGGASAGQIRATVEKIELDRLTLREANGRMHLWVIDDPKLFGDIILLNNQRVVARWRVIDGDTTFVGFTRVDPPARLPTPA